MAALTARLYQLYGARWDFYSILNRLEDMMRKAYGARSAYLRERDEEFLSGWKNADGKNAWYLRQDAVGMTLYVDLFSGDLKGLIEKIPYFKDFGISYVHLMPVFDCPQKENDGGYAVRSYRKVQKNLGTMDDFALLAKEFHKNGIKLVLDFVFNHTSDEHRWAKRAKKGEKKFQDFYFIYSDKTEVDEWNKTLREIFPTVRRGSFTFLEETGKWVWTTFNSFQWDLNYSNPDVFLEMCREMLFIANLGVDVLRLDALAFVWKEKGTSCENLSQAHLLIQAFQYVARIAAPSLIFKSEAIVHPSDVVKYIKSEECALSYNPLEMALLWSSLASRDTRLLTLSLKKRWSIPNDCAWVNYIRCHDDIGWTFSDEDACFLGIDPKAHRNFLNGFYTSRFEGSFAKGEAFQLNPATGDCRICGTTASLAGLEQAENSCNVLWKEMALRRMKMLYAVLFALPGIPLLYAGDEKAVFNDHSYKNDGSKAEDSRWVHRIKSDWTKNFKYPSQKEFSDFLKRISYLRSAEPLLGGNDVFFYDVQDFHVFAFRRSTIHIVANFSESPACFTIDAWSENSTDILSGRVFENRKKQELSPYEVRWLKENL